MLYTKLEINYRILTDIEFALLDKSQKITIRIKFIRQFHLNNKFGLIEKVDQEINGTENKVDQNPCAHRWQFACVPSYLIWPPTESPDCSLRLGKINFKRF